MFKTILKIKMRSAWRVLSHDWATYFLMGPIMLGVAFLLARRVYYDFGANVGRLSPVSLSEELTVRLVFGFLFLKVFFDFLPLAKRLYPTEQRLSVEDLLPIDFSTRYKIFYVEQLFRDLPFFAIATGLLLFLGKTEMLLWPFTIWFFFPGVEIGFALTWIHCTSPDRKQLAGVFAVLLLLLAILPIQQFSWWGDFFTILLMPLGYYKGFKHWRYQDMGRVEQFMLGHQAEAPQSSVTRLLGRLSRRLSVGLRALVLRDLILTARNFVPQVWRNMVMALLVLLAASVRGDTYLAVYCALASFIMATTVSQLFALQRPFKALDVPLPILPEQLWHSKLTYARLLAFPIPWLLIVIELVLRPQPLMESATLFLVLVLVSFAVSSLVGGSICEGDRRPVLQYIIAGFLSILATLFIVVFNPVLVLLVFPILNQLKSSAIVRLSLDGFEDL